MTSTGASSPPQDQQKFIFDPHLQPRVVIEKFSKSSFQSTSPPLTDSDSSSEEEEEEEEENFQKKEANENRQIMENMSDRMRQALEDRLKMVSGEKWVDEIAEENYPENLAPKIAQKLIKSYSDSNSNKGANNPKCKAKYRSILFNLKDPKNSLFSELLLGHLEPSTLIRMEPSDMASSELRAWRQQESAKELKMIEVAELDTLADKKRMEEAVAHRKVDKDEVDPYDAIVTPGTGVDGG